jgi:hypothetical protein
MVLYIINGHGFHFCSALSNQQWASRNNIFCVQGKSQVKIRICYVFTSILL